MTSVTFTVVINDDNILEGNETFTLTLTGYTFTAGALAQSTVTIIDTTST